MRGGKIQVVVRSKKVPARVVDVSKTQLSLTGAAIGGGTRQSIHFERRLDAEQARVVEDGRALARLLGLDFEVLDEAETNLFRRALSYLGARSSKPPKLVITPQHTPFVIPSLAWRTNQAV